MNKYIVTTTIYSPSKATLRFCEIASKKDWKFIIVGDTKTPHAAYKALEEKYPVVTYLDPEQQQGLYPELSDIIGWKTIERRNIGFVHAYKEGADVVATVDDDNIPYDSWGDDLILGKEVEVDCYNHQEFSVFDPISVTNHSTLWHRGYPINYVPKKNRIEYAGKKKIVPKVQAGFWDGDPDIDAICRLNHMPIVKFDDFAPFTSNQFVPFNSQNTFIAREVLPCYAMLPYIGRMDDIWGAYVLQKFFPESVVFSKASVFQDRNEQDLVTNLEHEIIGYRQTLELLNDLDNFKNYLPEKTNIFWDVYQKQFT